MSPNEYDIFIFSPTKQSHAHQQIASSLITFALRNDVDIDILRPIGCDARNTYPAHSDRNPASHCYHKLVPSIGNPNAEIFIHQSPHP